MASGSNAYKSINKFRKKNAGTGLVTSAKKRNPKSTNSGFGFDPSVGF